MTGGQTVTETLKVHDVDTIFGIISIHTLDLFDSLFDNQDSLRFIGGRQELGCGFMADGYARATGKPGILLTSTGPGAADSMGALGEAYFSSSAVLEITTNVEQEYIGSGKLSTHETKNQLQMFESVTDWNAMISQVESIPDYFVEAFQSGNIDAALGVTVSELDGSPSPEIGIATGYLEIIDATAGTTDLHGTVRIWGYGGSTYEEEWSDELDQIVGGIDSGDPDGDGDNELVVGTGGDDRESNEDTAEVRVYHRLGGSYALDGSVMDPGRYYAFGIDVGDIDNDGEEEITVGTGEYGESKSRVIIYDGDSHSEEFSKDVDSGSVWGVRSGDFDGDGFAELIYGTSGGELFIYDGETRDYEAKTSALSGMTGHYGGIVIGDVDNEAPLEMLVGSASYMWLFTTEGQTDTPDLAVEGTEIIYSPQNPNEDDDITISVTVHNYGGAVATDWRVKLYDGDPSAGGSRYPNTTPRMRKKFFLVRISLSRGPGSKSRRIRDIMRSMHWLKIRQSHDRRPEPATTRTLPP